MFEENQTQEEIEAQALYDYLLTFPRDSRQMVINKLLDMLKNL